MGVKFRLDIVKLVKFCRHLMNNFPNRPCKEVSKYLRYPELWGKTTVQSSCCQYAKRFLQNCFPSRIRISGSSVCDWCHLLHFWYFIFNTFFSLRISLPSGWLIGKRLWEQAVLTTVWILRYPDQNTEFCILSILYFMWLEGCLKCSWCFYSYFT